MFDYPIRKEARVGVWKFANRPHWGPQLSIRGRKAKIDLVEVWIPPLGGGVARWPPLHPQPWVGLNGHGPRSDKNFAKYVRYPTFCTRVCMGKSELFKKLIQKSGYFKRTPDSNICRAGTTEVDVPGYMRERKLVLEAG